MEYRALNYKKDNLPTIFAKECKEGFDTKKVKRDYDLIKLYTMNEFLKNKRIIDDIDTILYKDLSNIVLQYYNLLNPNDVAIQTYFNDKIRYMELNDYIPDMNIDEWELFLDGRYFDLC